MYSDMEEICHAPPQPPLCSPAFPSNHSPEFKKGETNMLQLGLGTRSIVQRNADSEKQDSPEKKVDSEGA
jgi:hypothetical protein